MQVAPRGIQNIIKDKCKVLKITEVAFKAVDVDGSGYLERNELEQVMIGVAEDIGVELPTKDEVEEVLRELDENGDGRVSMDEFQILIEQVLEMISSSESK